MADQSCCRSGVDTRIDLLPWADPYIVQLFAEAGLVGDAPEPESPLRAAWQVTRTACGPDLQAVFYTETRRIRSRRGSRPVFRKRRTEPARSLARSKAPAV